MEPLELARKKRDENYIKRMVKDYPVVGELLRDLNMGASEFCNKLGIRSQILSDLACGRFISYSYRDISTLSEAFGESVFNIFPDMHSAHAFLGAKEVELSYVDPMSLDDLEGESPIGAIEDQVCVGKLMSCLTPKEEFVIWCRFGLFGREFSLDDIGQLFSHTRECIRQIEVVALYKMRFKADGVNTKRPTYKDMIKSAKGAGYDV